MVSNYFELLGLEEEFSIDKALLHKAYIAAQHKYHPDRLLNVSEEERLAAIQKSADINKAYNTLRDDMLRAEYLLSLKGVFVGSYEHSGGKNAEMSGAIRPDADILMESLELRESLEEARAKAGDGNHSDEVKEIISRIENIKSESREEFQRLFDCGEYEKAAQAVIRWRFAEKISAPCRV